MKYKFKFVSHIFKYFLFILILLITACEKSKYLAPVVLKGQSIDVKIDNNKSKIIIVEEGSTLYSIARLEGISVRSLIEVNSLKPPFILIKGDKLIIPSALIHVVEKGDSLWKISECYGVNITTIINVNNLDDNIISIGKKLYIPAHNIQNRKKCNIKKTIIADKEIKIEESTIEENSNFKDSVYIWPVNGKILSKFGIQDKGMRNDGVNIIADKGQPVLATQDGKVVYSGNEIQAFGNLILIKHNNNRTSAYAHVDNVNVRKGQMVKKGEQIAKVSNTGKVNKPQLHFEIRDISGPIDPLKLLPFKNL